MLLLWMVCVAFVDGVCCFVDGVCCFVDGVCCFCGWFHYLLCHSTNRDRPTSNYQSKYSTTNGCLITHFFARRICGFILEHEHVGILKAEVRGQRAGLGHKKAEVIYIAYFCISRIHIVYELWLLPFYV